MKGRLLDAVPLSSLTGVGAALSNKLAKINLHTVQDLLLHLPLRYEDRTHLYPIGELLPGVYATVEGEVLNCNISFGGRRMMTCQISDGSGILTMRFFNFSAAMKNSLAAGRRVLAYGEAKRGKYGAEMIHPEYRVQGDLSTPELQETLTPVYPTTEGVKQATLRKLTDQALDLLDTCAIEELLPPELSQGMMTLPEALRTLHRPPPTLQLSDLETGQHPAQRRLILEELLAHNLSMLALRAGAQRFHAQPLSANDTLKNKLLAALPFKPTGAQARVVAEIERDMALDVPMMRLVQGDVGSGKTLVAALAALRAIAHGKQVALMAPTELLAEQHANNFRNWFAPLGIEVGWLAGKQKGKARLAQQEAIASGQVQMIVGTHAIFQEQVQFNGLALVIIDEQQLAIHHTEPGRYAAVAAAAWSNETGRYRRRWSAAFHRAAAPDAIPAADDLHHRSAPTDASTCRHPRGSPWKKAQTHLPVQGSTPEYRRSDPHDPALTGCSSHHNPVRARRGDDHRSACRQSRQGIPRQDLSLSPAHALWHRDPDNETVTPGCVRSGSDPAGTVPGQTLR